MAAPRPVLPPLAVRPREAARQLGVSRSRLYQLLKSGKIPHRKDGAATVIVHEDLVAYHSSLSTVTPDEGPTGPLLSAIEPAMEPSAPDLAAVYAERFRLIARKRPVDEARLRACSSTQVDRLPQPLPRRLRDREEDGFGRHQGGAAEARIAAVTDNSLCKRLAIPCPPDCSSAANQTRLACPVHRRHARGRLA